jgi:hypothetical protein
MLRRNGQIVDKAVREESKGRKKMTTIPLHKKSATGIGGPKARSGGA